LVVGTKNIQIMEDLGVVGKKHELVVGMGPGQIGGVCMPSLCVWGGMLDNAFSLIGNGFATGGASSEEGSLQQQWCELSVQQCRALYFKKTTGSI
jgi:hypothetical protein